MLLIANYLTHSLQCIVVIEIAMVVALLSQLTTITSALVKSPWKMSMLSLFGLRLTLPAVLKSFYVGGFYRPNVSDDEITPILDSALKKSTTTVSS